MDAVLIPTFLCPKAWQSMAGNDKERHCSYCNKSVHNLAAMTARERLALLSSPAANVCSRYRVAIRRPAPGKRANYYRHLMKYGVGVAAAGTALVVLWERAGKAEQDRYYQVAGSTMGREMPREWYEERFSGIKGDVAYVPRQQVKPPTSLPSGAATTEEITLDAAAVDRAIEPLEPSDTQSVSGE